MSQEYKMKNSHWCSKSWIYLFLKGSQKDQSNIRSHQKRIIVYPFFGTGIEILSHEGQILDIQAGTSCDSCIENFKSVFFFFVDNLISSWRCINYYQHKLWIEKWPNKLQAKRNHKKMLNSNTYKLANFLQRILFPISSIGVCDYYIHFSL